MNTKHHANMFHQILVSSNINIFNSSNIIWDDVKFGKILYYRKYFSIIFQHSVNVIIIIHTRTLTLEMLINLLKRCFAILLLLCFVCDFIFSDTHSTFSILVYFSSYHFWTLRTYIIDMFVNFYYVFHKMITRKIPLLNIPFLWQNATK